MQMEQLRNCILMYMQAVDHDELPEVCVCMYIYVYTYVGVYMNSLLSVWQYQLMPHTPHVL